MQLLPSKFYFPVSVEHDFQYQLNKSSLRLANASLYLVSLFSLFFIINSWSNTPEPGSAIINILRTLMLVLSITLIVINKKLNPEQLHSRYFIYGVLFCFLFGYFFWSYAHVYSELKEGAPMLVAASFVAIPMLHLGHKLILWLIIAASLACVQWLSATSIVWTLYFYICMVIVMAVVQYQLDILLRKQYKAELHETEKGRIDQLTGMNNRHSFDSDCKALIDQLRPSQYIALAMIDIDFFKKYNDNYGHLEGDHTLAEVACRLQQCNADVVVRFGGEEFVLVKILAVNELDWLSDLSELFAENPIAHAYSPFNRITVSTGVAIDKYSNKQRPCIARLLAAADTQMYQAKKVGKNTTMTHFMYNQE